MRGTGRPSPCPAPKDSKKRPRRHALCSQTLGPDTRRVQSYATADTVHCVYVGLSEDTRGQAEGAGFSANAVMAIKAVIDSTTAEPELAAA